MTDQNQKELRLKSGQKILSYMRQFSATEKVIFGVFTVTAIVTTLIMLNKINNSFMVEIPAYGGNLNEGTIGLPRTINPVLAATDVDRDISALIYSGLMKYEDNKIVNDMAETWNVSPDGLTYSFTIKDKIRFSDGTPLTTDDIAFTVEKILDPALKSTHRADWANVNIEIVSPKEIRFTLKQPYSPFLSNLTTGIIPKHIWNGLTDDQFVLSKYNIEPIGSGPYKISSVSYDNGGIPSKIKLETWRGYHGSKPHLSNITFGFYSDEGKALEALGTGTIDSLASISPDEAAKLATNSAEAYTILSSPLPRVFGIFFNQNQNLALADKYVRQALNMSVDREAIVKTALSGYGVPIYSPLPLSVQEDSDSTDRKVSSNAKFDIAGAMTLLEKNGWKKNSNGIYEKKSGKSVVTLSFDIYTADASDLKEAAEIVKDNWTKLGASVGIKIFETGDLYQNVIRTRKYDALLFGQFIGKDRDLYAFWHSSQRNAPGLNVSMYANSKVDKLLEEIRAGSDDAVRNSKYTSLDQAISADYPAVFLYVPDFIYAVPKSLGRVDLHSMVTASDRWNDIGDWYMTTEKVWKIFATKEN